MLPVLYNVAPALQALALLTGSSIEPAGPGRDLARVIPITSLSGVQERTVADFQDFVEALDGDSDVVVMIDADGSCIWTSDGLQSGDGYLTIELEQALLRIVGHPPRDDLMDEG